MKVGDLVVRKSDRTRILGVVLRLFVIVNELFHKEPLRMAEVATKDGKMVWKCRKIEVIDESCQFGP